MTLTSASVLRAICPISVDLPTPEPANRPMRCPSPTVSSASMARTPRRQRAVDAAAAQRIGRGAIDRPVLGVADERAQVVHRLAQAVEHPAEQPLAEPTIDSGRPMGVTIASGPIAGDVAERHQHHLVAAEADHLGPQRGGRCDSISTISPTRMPGTVARTTRPVTSVTRPEMRSGLMLRPAPPAPRRSR